MPDDIALWPLGIDRGVQADALSGLLAAPKTLPAKLFYDEEGCGLFYRITELPEYYLTRTERTLLTDIAPKVTAALPPETVLVEYGASDDEKAGYLLRERRSPHGRPAITAYVPIDVAAAALRQLGQRLQRSRPDLPVHPITADFQRPISLPDAVAGQPRLGFFPGSTIGNLEPPAAVQFLSQAAATLGAGARFLVGADLRKDPNLLIPAYDDAEGVTAAFNRNLLVRLNREAGADFDLAAFTHRAVWNDAESRIEMHLVSQRAQSVHIGGTTIRFAPGETIHTENSYKHTPQHLIAMARKAGWNLQQMWTDRAELFAMYLLVR